jgi:hypothetical protein
MSNDATPPDPREKSGDSAPVHSVSGRAPRPRSKRRGRLLEIGIAIVLTPIALGYAMTRVTGNPGLAHIQDDEVAVLVDYARGTQALVGTPGYRTYIPWLQEFYALDKSPNAFVMKGNVETDANHAPRLLVRAKDGSSFWFDEFTLQYALNPEKAAFVLEDSGPGDAFKRELVKRYARSILRDEFGRFSAEEVVRPENLQSATRASLERLNAALGPHGIDVLEVSTPKPAFDKTYEEQIARRKVANQEVERLSAELGQLAQLRLQRESAVRNDKQSEMSKLEGDLVRDVGKSRAELVRAKSEADNVYLEKVSQGRATKLEKDAQAAVLLAKYTALAEDSMKHTAALEARGESAVRAALVEKLHAIEFNLVPYSRDPSPKRVENEAATTASLGSKH